MLLKHKLLYNIIKKTQENNNNISPILLAIIAKIDDLFACIRVYQKFINK